MSAPSIVSERQSSYPSLVFAGSFAAKPRRTALGSSRIAGLPQLLRALIRMAGMTRSALSAASVPCAAIGGLARPWGGERDKLSVQDRSAVVIAQFCQHSARRR